MAWGLGPHERIRTSLWPGDLDVAWGLGLHERIRTSLWPGDLDVAWGLGPLCGLGIRTP